MLEKYLENYANSECPLYDNIYLIWNNHEKPEQLGVMKKKNTWKKNVHFLQTIYNSMDLRYIIPPWAPE
jgi:hypothetical protein